MFCIGSIGASLIQGVMRQPSHLVLSGKLFKRHDAARFARSQSKRSRALRVAIIAGHTRVLSKVGLGLVTSSSR